VFFPDKMAHEHHCIRLLSECSVADHDHDNDSLLSMTTEEQAIELIKESLVASEGETDYDASVTHAFIILGASVSGVFL
jgi:hypothetical protein